jgi:ligand-binding sensor domain-containing protein
MNPKIKNIIFILIFCVVIAAVIYWDKLQVKKEEIRRVPVGWQIILPQQEVYCLAIQGDVVWAGGKEGVYAIDRKSGALIRRLEHEPPFAYVKGLGIDDQGTLWIAHEQGLTSYDGKNFANYNKDNGLPDNRTNSVFLDRAGRLWVGTWSGAVVREQGSFRVLNKSDGLMEDMVNVIFQDKEGGIWFGAYVAPAGGISYLKDGKWQYFSTRDGLPHNNVSAIFQNKEGNIWVATGLLDRGGAAQLSQVAGRWQIKRVLTKRDGLAGEKVRSIFQDKDGMFWFGSEYDGIALVSNGKKRIMTDKNGLSNPEIKVILQDKDGDMWLGTRSGLTRIRYSSYGQLLP